jgi:hypothetical protein
VIQGGELNSECVLNQSFSISSCSVMSITLSLDHELAAPLNLFDCRDLRPTVLANNKQWNPSDCAILLL